VAQRGLVTRAGRNLAQQPPLDRPAPARPIFVLNRGCDVPGRSRGWHRLRSRGSVCGQPCHPGALDGVVEPTVGAVALVALRIWLHPDARKPGSVDRSGCHRCWALRLLLDDHGPVRRRIRRFESARRQRPALVERPDHRRRTVDGSLLRLPRPTLAK